MRPTDRCFVNKAQKEYREKSESEHDTFNAGYTPIY